MTNSTRTELFDDLSARISRDVTSIDAQLSPVEVDVFFADELLFASATVRDEDGAIRWRSSHAATPDSTSIAHLAEAGEDLVARIAADARLAGLHEANADD